MTCAECLKVLESQKSVTQKCSSSAQQLHSIYIYICIYISVYIYILYICVYIYMQKQQINQQLEMKQAETNNYIADLLNKYYTALKNTKKLCYD